MELTTIETKSYFYKAPNQPFKQVVRLSLHLTHKHLEIKSKRYRFFWFYEIFFLCQVAGLRKYTRISVFNMYTVQKQ